MPMNNVDQITQSAASERPLDGDLLRKQFNKRFRQVVELSHPSFGLFILFGDFITIVAIAASTAWLQGISSWLAVVVYPFAVFLIGFRMRSFTNIIHECTHMTFVAGRVWNRAIGKFLSILLFTSFERYRDDHMTHHRYTGDFERDRDFADTVHFGFETALNFKQWVRMLRWLVTFEFYPIYVGTTVKDENDTISWRFARYVYVALLATSLCTLFFNATLGWFVLAFWIVPMITSLPAIGFMSDIMDHAGMVENASEIDRSRNYFVQSKVLRWLFFPRNDVFHLTHHMFPQVPVRCLEQCHQILLDESPEYRARRHTFREWWLSFKDGAERGAARVH